jgi:outer membrane biosynthesis protein TonB
MPKFAARTWLVLVVVAAAGAPAARAADPAAQATPVGAKGKAPNIVSGHGVVTTPPPPPAATPVWRPAPAPAVVRPPVPAPAPVTQQPRSTPAAAKPAPSRKKRHRTGAARAAKPLPTRTVSAAEPPARSGATAQPPAAVAVGATANVALPSSDAGVSWVVVLILGALVALLGRELLGALHIAQRVRRRFF